jgi:hypothetical protein
MNRSCKNNFYSLQRSSLQVPNETGAAVFPAQLDQEAKALTEEDKYLSVLNLIYAQPSGAVITKATLAEELDLVPRVNKSSITIDHLY